MRHIFAVMTYPNVTNSSQPLILSLSPKERGRKPRGNRINRTLSFGARDRVRG